MVSLQCDPKGVGIGLTTYPRVFGAAPLDLWLGNGHPQGVPAPTNPARQVPDPAFIALSQRMMDPAFVATYHRPEDPAFIALYRLGEDPARDPRFIATGRAATAAMTCGQIIVRTSTPCGSH